MFSITPAAGAHLAKILADSETGEEEAVVVRMFMAPEGLGLALSTEQPGDAKFEHDGALVLVIDEQLSLALDGRELDVEATEDGEALTIH